jgi:plasmid replication initiation protein
MKQNESKFPKLSNPDASIIKPQELIDIVEMSPLTLNDRRIFNLLLGHAWNNIFDKDTHIISRYDLVKYVDSNNQDIPACFRRLMSAIVQIKIPNNRNGKEAIRQIPLLGVNEIETNGAEIKYSFPPELVKIIKDTSIFARIHTDVMFQLSSKYSLTLYEFLQKRGNLKHINYELLSINELRGLFAIPKNKLKLFGHLNDKAIKPAIKEVSFLSDFEIEAEPIKTGRSVTHIKFSWTRKTDIGKQISAVEELQRQKIGRKERMNNQVETLTEETQPQGFHKIGSLAAHHLPHAKIQVPIEAIEEAKQLILTSSKRPDIYKIEQEFLDYATQNPPKNLHGAFLGFVKKKIKDNP